MPLDRDTRSQLPQSPVIGHPLDLRPISARMTKLGIAQPMLQLPIIRQQKQSFAVMIKPAYRIDVPHLDKVFQGATLAGELAHHTIRLIEQDVPELHEFSVSPNLIGNEFES